MLTSVLCPVQERIKDERVYLSYRTYSPGNPSQAIFSSLPVSEIPITLTYINRPKNIQATHAMTLSAEELGTISKDNLRGISEGDVTILPACVNSKLSSYKRDLICQTICLKKAL